MATYHNRVPTATLSSVYGNVFKWVEMLLFDGGLESKFDVFDRERQFGDGREETLVLSATEYNGKQNEHSTYNAKTQVITYTGSTAFQYSVSIKPVELKRVSTSEKAQKEYAAKLVDCLYQGWINSKNTHAYTDCVKVVLDHAPAASSVTITTGSEESGVKTLLAQLKAYVASLFEGVTGSSFSNTTISDRRIAARDVVMVMNHDTAAMLDAFGYASAFNEDYLKVNNVTRIETDRLVGNNILIMDARNVVIEKLYENLVEIENSDGSVNNFYNVEAAFTVAYDGTTGHNFLGYPAKKFSYTVSAS